jgi:hypothetical protein
METITMAYKLCIGRAKTILELEQMVPWECLQRPSVSHLCMDMTQLSELNEPSVLECIRRRYHSHRLIHVWQNGIKKLNKIPF